MSDKIILTYDGSHTIKSERFGVSYHSIHGAIQETNHVFIKSGLIYISKYIKDISILEIGWGTGLNSFVSLIEAKNNKLKVDYTAIEAYPITLEQAAQLNYDQVLKTDEKLVNLHKLSWEESHQVNDNFSLKKRKMSFEDIEDIDLYDIIYFDAFAPNAQSEFWEAPFLQKMFNALKPNGILVTYCAKGSFKRALIAVGFDVQKIPGPPGKREMIRAYK